MTQELKGCPFCGCATRVQSNRDWHRLSGDHDDDCVWGRYDAVMMVPAQPDQLAAMVHAWNRRAPDARDARIAELEAALIAEAKKTANEKTRADQMTEQHRMQAKMHAEATEELARLRQQIAKQIGCPIPSSQAGATPATPWYPDDSGEWVEVPEDLMEMPPGLQGNQIIEVVYREEREDQDWSQFMDKANSWHWNFKPSSAIRIVAYKVVKP